MSNNKKKHQFVVRGDSAAVKYKRKYILNNDVDFKLWQISSGNPLIFTEGKSCVSNGDSIQRLDLH